MTVLARAYEYLKKIVVGSDSFTEILNRTLPNSGISTNDILLIKDILKSVVNKYCFLKYEVFSFLDKKNEISDDELNVLIIGLAMIQYVKNQDVIEVMSLLSKDYENLPLTLTLDEINTLFNSIGKKPISIPEKFNKILSKKVSLQYSYPEWIVKMMFKHFGVKDSYKSIASSRHSQPIVVNYNPMKIEEVELDDKKFNKTLLSTTGYLYTGKERIINIDLFKQNKIFVEDEASQLLIDVLNPEQGDDLLFVDNSKGVLALDACLRVNDFAKINVCCHNSLALQNTRNIVNRFKLQSIEAFESNVKLLITHVETNKMDKALFIPKSSSLGLVRRNPDILLSLKRDNLDQIIENERESLEEIATFVKKGGILLYGVFTMNKKEGQLLIKEFLEKHSEFLLEDERQVFPYEGPSDGVYYAKLYKKGK